ncbi:MDR family MFS transporter [Microbacterium gorillae]|uniref:MDR family MFS transporter n=1 Tax=Microbacterium gorillae TaxID=1231063 RepID=UPI000ACF6CCD|nr:MDR family MFS transporter [Microbacterium gorillae]
MSTQTAAPTTGSTPIMSHRQIMLVIYGLMAGMFLSSLDQTVVGTAIRTIGDDLHGLDQQAWVTTAYLITSTVTTPIYGKLSDVFGRRPLYLFGIGVFIVGSLLSSFSTSMLMLAGFRAFQGIGAGALMSLPLAIMGDVLAPRERAKYQGYFMSVFAISAVIGPLVGGLFAGTPEILWIAGWRWVFLINVPIGLVALGMVWRFLHLPRFHSGAKPRIDWWGATMVVVTLVPLLLIAEQGREWGWTSVAAFVCYGIGAAGLIAFLIIESRMGTDAIIPLRLFRRRPFSMSIILGFLIGFGMFGAMLTLPLYLQIVLGQTPTESGWAMLPMVAGIMLAAMGSGQIVARTGKYRIFPVTGTLTVTIGYLLLSFLTADTPYWYLAICMLVVGLGFGQLMQSLTLATQASVEPQDMGVATSSSTFFRQIGGTLGTAVLLSVLFTVVGGNITTAMTNKTDLTAALNAALNPAVASEAHNAGVMKQIWTPVTGKLQDGIATKLDEATTKTTDAVTTAVTAKVTQAVEAQVAAGVIPAAQKQAVIDAQVKTALPDATAEGLKAAAAKANATVTDGKLAVDWSDRTQREAWVKELVPTIVTGIKDGTSGSSGSSDSSISDTSFVTGATPALTRPFLVGFTKSVVTVYWVGFGVMALAFLIALFFRPPELHARSALQEAADRKRAAEKAAASDGSAEPESDPVVAEEGTPEPASAGAEVSDHPLSRREWRERHEQDAPKS